MQALMIPLVRDCPPGLVPVRAPIPEIQRRKTAPSISLSCVALVRVPLVLKLNHPAGREPQRNGKALLPRKTSLKYSTVCGQCLEKHCLSGGSEPRGRYFIDAFHSDPGPLFRPRMNLSAWRPTQAPSRWRPPPFSLSAFLRRLLSRDCWDFDGSGSSGTAFLRVKLKVVPPMVSDSTQIRW